MLSGYYKELQISKNLSTFSKNLSTRKFLEELIYKEIQKIWNYYFDEDTTLLSAYTQASQILPLSMNAQTLLLSEIRRFFLNFFFGKLRFKKIHKILDS